MKSSVVVVFIVGSAWLVAGCGDDDPSTVGCVPGRVVDCPCLGGGTGVQECQDDNTYGDCMCLPPIDASIAPPDAAPDAAPPDAATPDAAAPDATPLETVIVVYPAKSTGAAGGRTGVNSICATEQALHSELDGFTSLGLVCVTGPTEVQDFPTLFGVPSDARVLSFNGTQLATSWSGFMTGLDATLFAAGLFSGPGVTQFMTGCGNVSGLGCVHDCLDWTSNSASVFGCVGRDDRTDETWIAWGNILSCEAERDILCIAHGEMLP